MCLASLWGAPSFWWQKKKNHNFLGISELGAFLCSECCLWVQSDFNLDLSDVVVAEQSLPKVWALHLLWEKIQIFFFRTLGGALCFLNRLSELLCCITNKDKVHLTVVFSDMKCITRNREHWFYQGVIPEVPGLEVELSPLVLYLPEPGLVSVFTPKAYVKPSQFKWDSELEQQ